MIYLDFEKPIEEISEQIEKLKQVASKNKVDVNASVRQLEEKIKLKKIEVYSKLTPWQRVQLSRHPDRP
ncbi:MAG TPA: acetyl-CoA carboxylase carboxyl transferase subunit alpha, partial [Chitinophagales bacterium]|nr:acetyl-CoA carboxylase carboxyl transferase subunit alpha [Chitinophagales bacterium]